MVDIDLIYNISVHKLHNFQTTRRDSDGLRKLVLLNNFVCKKFVSPEQEEDLLEWSEEDIKKDEENWLDSCLDELDDEDGYVYINNKPLEHQSTVASFPIDRYDDPRQYEDYYVQDNNNAMEYESHSHEKQQQPQSQQQQQQPLPSSNEDNVIDDVIIPHNLLFFDPGGNDRMVIDEEHHDDDDDDDLNASSTSNDSSTSSLQDDDVNMTEIEDFSESLTCEKGFHPYWKDNSIISHPSSSPNTHSFGIPKIFHKYRFGQDEDASSPRRVGPANAVLELLQSDYLYQSFKSPLRRSKDDLDILYSSLTPRDLDRGVLMDMISMLEYYGSKTNHNKSNSSEINNVWFMDNK